MNLVIIIAIAFVLLIPSPIFAPSHPEYVGFEKPLKQVMNGVAPEAVKCSEGLMLIIRTSGSPACVTIETAEKFEIRGLGMIPPPCCKTIHDESIQEESIQECDESYPDVCIASYSLDLDCDEIGYSNFRVIGSDPHGFDDDYNGIGCETGSPSGPVPTVQENICDSSYPDVCIAEYPPDLDCGEIAYSNFRVIGGDPHGFDRDNDGIGCEN